MKKSQQHNQSKTNVKSVQITQQSAARTRARTKAKTKIRSFASSVALTTSRHFGVLSYFSHPAAKSTLARHFRANSYVPLLLALRPRAGSLAVALASVLGGGLLGSAIFPTSASAASLTLTIPSTPLSLNAVPNGKVSQTASDESNGANSIKVETTALAGYTLTIKAKDDSKALVNGTYQLPSIDKALEPTEYDADGLYLNTWSYLPSMLDGVANTKYQPSPLHTTPTVIDTTTSPNAGAPKSYTLSLAAKVDASLPAGSYQNTFTFTATANQLEYTINYHPNGNGGSEDDSDVTGTPTTQEGGTDDLEGASVQLSPDIPTRPGYEFKGWCSTVPTRTGERDACPETATVYQPEDEYMLANARNTLDLYAMWNELLLTDVIEPETGKAITFKVGDGIELVMVASSKQETQHPPIHPESTTTTRWWPFYAIQGTDVTMDPPEAGEKFLITVVPQKNNKFTKWQKNNDGTEWTAVGETGSYKPMQDLTQAECTAAGAGGMNVTDTRNNVSYTVGQFAERCWMFSNLRLEGGTELTPENSDVNEATSVAEAVMASEWVDYYTKKEMIECKGKAGQSVMPFESDPNEDQNRFCADVDNQNVVTEFYYN